MRLVDNNTDALRKGRRPAVGRSRVLAEIRHRIVRGELPVGGRVPNRRELAAEFAVSTFTVQQALQRLEADGFIKSSGRHGTFVRNDPPHLCQYGLIFAEKPEEKEDWSRFWSGLISESQRINEAGPRRVQIFFGIDGHRDTESYRKLLSDVRRERLAGLVFVHTPRPGMRESTIITQPGIPRVMMNDERFLPGIHGIHPGEFVILERALDEVKARGKRRPAILTTWGESHQYVPFATALAQSRGLELLRANIQHVDSRAASWGAQAVDILFGQPDSTRPDSLIIEDDNLVEDATAGLLRSRGDSASDVLVVHHCNFPHPPPSCVPCVRIGFDLRQWLNACFDAIDQMRRGVTRPQLPVIPALREDELPDAAITRVERRDMASTI